MSAAKDCERQGRKLTTACRILVADDNVDVVESLALLMQVHGHEVRTACNGVEAVQMAEQFLPQVVFMDLGMPLLDGVEAGRQIRQAIWGKDMVIVAVSGWGSDQAKQRTRGAGFNGHLVKPASEKDLLQIIASASAGR